MSTGSTMTDMMNNLMEVFTVRQEPEWMMTHRKLALELAGWIALPKLEKTKLDRWNFGPIGTYKESGRLASLQDLPREATRRIHPDHVIVGRNSGIGYSHVSEELLAQGVIFTDLDTAVREHADLVQPYYMQAIRAEENRITALHAAARTGGVFLYVPQNVHIELPLQAMFILDEADSIFMPHVLIVAEANSRVTFMENVLSFVSGEGSPLHSGMIEAFVKPGANVSVVSIHNLECSVTDMTYRRAVVEQDGKIAWIIGELNDGNAVSDTTSILRGNGAESDAKVICIGKGEQKLDLTTRAVHFGKSTSSDMITRAVMTERSTAIINGITKIEKGASGTNGQQTERVLMLSPQARGDANPILLIDEDDVQAGHAASVGQVNPEQLYYLMSRGIARDEAERLIIHGFLAPVIAEIPYEDLQDQILRLVERKLG